LKQSLLYLACILCFTIDSVIPGGLGIWDYAIPSLLSTIVAALALTKLSGIKTTHIIKRKSYTVHISSSIYYLEGIAVLAALMVGMGYIPHVKKIDFWYENYGLILHVINMIELLICLAGVPVGDIYNSLANGLRSLRGNGTPAYQRSVHYPIIGD